MSRKLTAAQVRVMKWLALGWQASPGAGSAITVNGARVCSLATMLELQHAGLVQVDPQQCWKATEAGIAIRPYLVG